MRLIVLLAVLAGVVFAAPSAWDAALPSLKDHWRLRQVHAHEDVLREASREAGVDADLLAGVMLAESSGRVGARSSKGALGLFQLMPVTAAERARALGLPEPTEEDLVTDAALNARLGANYMRWMLDRFEENEEAALVAYNRGPTRVKRWIRESGSYEAWRDERLAAGGSDMIDYARKVLRYRDLVREREIFEKAPPVE